MTTADTIRLFAIVIGATVGVTALFWGMCRVYTLIEFWLATHNAKTPVAHRAPNIYLRDSSPPERDKYERPWNQSDDDGPRAAE